MILEPPLAVSPFLQSLVTARRLNEVNQRVSNFPRGMAASADLLLADELDGEERDYASDAEADALLEDMKRLRSDVAAAMDTVDSRTDSADVAADKMHSRLTASVLDIINNVASGVDQPEEDPTETASADAHDEQWEQRDQSLVDDAAAISLVGDEQWHPPERPVAADTASSSASGSAPPSATGRGRFKVPAPQQPEARAVVNDISRLASKPLLDDSIPLARRPKGGPQARAMGSRIGR